MLIILDHTIILYSKWSKLSNQITETKEIGRFHHQISSEAKTEQKLLTSHIFSIDNLVAKFLATY